MDRFGNFWQLIVKGINRRQNPLKREASRDGLSKDTEYVVRGVLRKELWFRAAK